MEDQIEDIMNKLHVKRITIDYGMYAGGCAAVPQYSVTGESDGYPVTATAMELEDALKRFEEQLSANNE